MNHGHCMVAALWWGAAVGAVASNATAEVIHVPGDFGTIQAAIADASTGDEIVVAPGSYPENIDFLGKSITLRSADPGDPEVVAATIIDAENSGTVVSCRSAEGPETVLDGFTIRGGNAGGGGGMLITGSRPTVRRCVFTGNRANRGGGMLNFCSDPVIQDCTFTGNTARNEGGGMININSAPQVGGCAFLGNSSGGHGGGMANGGNEGSRPAVSGCTCRDNGAAESGGGMYSTMGSEPVVRESLFEDNDAAGAVNDGGGAVSVFEGSCVLLVDCTFRGNTARDDGGAVRAAGASVTLRRGRLVGNVSRRAGGAVAGSGGAVVATACAFIANAADHAGAIEGGAGPLQVTCCTFVNNRADPDAGGTGGAVRAGAGAVARVSQSTFSGNVALEGGAVLLHGDGRATIVNSILWGDGPDEIAETDQALATVHYSDVAGGWSGAGGHGMNADPRFLDPDGPDDDPATGEDNDYRLGPSSPCVDAGNNWGVPADDGDLDGDGDLTELAPRDLDGTARFARAPEAEGGGCGVPVIVDLGAYEAEGEAANPVLPGDVSGDAAVDFLDVLYTLLAWGECRADCCLADLDLSGAVDADDLTVVVTSWRSAGGAGPGGVDGSGLDEAARRHLRELGE